MSDEFVELSPGFMVERRRVLRMIGVGAVGSAMAAPVGTAAAEGPAADLVLHSGTVWTGRPHGRPAEGVAVLGKRVVAVGTNLDVLAWKGKRTRVIELRGAFVAPGFRDQHTHLLNQADADAAAEVYQPKWEGHDEDAAFESRRATGAAAHRRLRPGQEPGRRRPARRGRRRAREQHHAHARGPTM